MSIPEKWTRYPKLWLSLLRLCYRVDRRTTVQALTAVASCCSRRWR